MHLIEIVLEGFKSYCKRTVVGPFDEQFNAFTGRNGSGKSNILDAICFVLGITDLSQVRVKTLQELVYKNGQAGITKASVTLKFDNHDTASSPHGYDQFSTITVTRQVVIGGQSKYILNGHNAAQQKVLNLFHSVGLNVNNPQFLIMQGRIKQVTSMTPKETLGMISEACGTAMYEDKKQKALKTMARKDTKMTEIVQMLNQDILPQLEKLRSEQASLLKFNSAQHKIDGLRRFTIAYQYYKYRQLANATDPKLEKLEERNDELIQSLGESRTRLGEIDEKLLEMTAAREHVETAGYRELEQAVLKLGKQLVKVKSEWKHRKEAAERKSGEVRTCERELTELTNQIAEQETVLFGLKSSTGNSSDVYEASRARVEELESRYEALSTGLNTEKGASDTIAGQLQAAQKAATQANTLQKQAHMRLAKAKKELVAKEKDASKLSSHSGLGAEKANAEQELGKLRLDRDATGFDPEREQSLAAERSAISKELASVDKATERAAKNLSRCRFQGGEGVRGTVAELIRVKESHTNAALALEIAAGGSLFHVVVDDDKIGQRVISEKHARRVTVIPLNKVATKPIKQSILIEVQKDAAKISGSNGENAAWIAKDLLEYSDMYEPAMSHVFGRTIICSSSDVAKHVAKVHKIRAVTHTGDVYDPRGTLTGGDRGSKDVTPLLLQLEQFHLQSANLDRLRAQKQSVDEALAELRVHADSWRTLQQEVVAKEHAVALLVERLGQTDDHQLEARIVFLRGAIEEDEALIEKAKADYETSKQREKELKKELQDFESSRETQLTALKKEIASAKKARDSAKKGKSSVEDGLNEASAQLEESKAEYASKLEDKKSLVKEQEAAAVSALEQQQLVEKASVEHAAKEAALEEQKERLRQADLQLGTLRKEGDTLRTRIGKDEAEQKRVAIDLAKREGNRKSAQKAVDDLEKEHSWIPTERTFFGQVNTDYDFNARDPNKVERELNNLEREQAKVGREMNKNAAAMYEKAEADYQQLMVKKEMVENDRAQIEKVIAELDSKKEEALQVTYKEVNKSFGKIFETLLPGARAELAVPEGAELVEGGLEMRVAFGNMWKSSLSELSGGQRALLALSLVLALLRYKPAPVYILDEIDAALDLSHTQNIGLMLKRHFSTSQFLVVSHKEELFMSANVVFRMNVVDGVFLGIDRTTNTAAVLGAAGVARTRDDSAAAASSAKRAGPSGPQKRKMQEQN